MLITKSGNIVTVTGSKQEIDELVRTLRNVVLTNSFFTRTICNLSSKLSQVASGKIKNRFLFQDDRDQFHAVFASVLPENFIKLSFVTNEECKNLKEGKRKANTIYHISKGVNTDSYEIPLIMINEPSKLMKATSAILLD